MKELKKKIEEIKTVCMDRLDAVTAEGNRLDTVFEELEAIVSGMEENKPVAEKKTK